MLLLSLVSLVLLSLSRSVLANSACVAFDINWDLLAFGFNGKDYNAGPQASWTSSAATDITTTGRPPFNGPNATCYLSEFTNAIYVLGADTSNPTSIYIYDATGKNWTTQAATVASGLDLTDFDAILDHDTNVFYAFSKGVLFSLDMQLLKAAQSAPVVWNNVQELQLGAGYEPVMALAQNHIHFLAVPGVPDGSAQIFVIHFSFLQPEPQSFGTFPNTHGQATSIFLDSGVQENFVFVPDSGASTFVINVETNTTQTMHGPPAQDALATYFASTTSIIQLASSGVVSFLPFSPVDGSANSAADWKTVTALPNAHAAAGSPSASTGSQGGRSSSMGASGTAESAGGAALPSAAAAGSTGAASGAMEVRGARWMAVASGMLLLLGCS